MKNKEEFVIYKLKKAAQSIKEAKLLMINAMYDIALSRLHYAAFYAVNALLHANRFNPQTRTGTKTIFNTEFFFNEKIR